MQRTKNMMSLFIALGVGCSVGPAGYAAKPTSSPNCQSYVGKPATLLSFDSVLETLPEFQPKGAFETTAQYEARMSETTGPMQQPVLIKVIQDHRTAGLIYDADTQELTIYDSVFGIDTRDYFSIRQKLAPKPQSFASDIAFDVEKVKTAEEFYSTTNGFGAQVQVKKSTYATKVIWEAQVPEGRRPFVGQKSLIVARLKMSPQTAQALYHTSETALQIIPRFKTQGLTFSTPSLSFPFESVQKQTVIVGDVQCGYILHADKTIAYAFDVK